MNIWKMLLKKMINMKITLENICIICVKSIDNGLINHKHRASTLSIDLFPSIIV